MLRSKKKVAMKNTKLRPRNIGGKSSALDVNSSAKKLSNPAAAGGLLGIRKFGLNAGGG
jgi:hypothetical protein